jgi:hypothetical protein
LLGLSSVRHSTTLKAATLAGWFFACVAALGCFGSERENLVKFSVIPVQGQEEAIQPAASVITDEQGWKAFLTRSRHAGTPPKVDFTKQMVISIFAGEKPTGGFSVRVTKVIDDSSRAVVHWQLRAPPPDAMVTQALTYPSLLIRIEKRFDRVEFNPPIPRAPAAR